MLPAALLAVPTLVPTALQESAPPPAPSDDRPRVLVVSGALLFGGAEGPVGGMILAASCGSLLALDAYRRQRRAPDSVLPGLVRAFRTRTVPAKHALRDGIQVGFVRNVDSLGVQTLPTLILGSLAPPSPAAEFIPIQSSALQNCIT